MIAVLKLHKYGGPATVAFFQESDMAGIIQATIDHTWDVQVWNVREASAKQVYPVTDEASMAKGEGA